MLHKWKFIISNWINCYFNDTKTEECITVNTLLTIISHLHKNLNLDESKSSIIEAQNIEEFILEKYPEFKFGNDSLEPTNEEELYAIASLLLLFVCVNSKDVGIKQAMCSRLSPEDQETIMKFSKNLMECSPITYGDVQAAIIEACGPENASCERGASVTSVAETPPALRSLHGEVRRLQAALDAERFDRNYLQEELSRTNLRMEKLQKDKEQYKLEILNLKARISMCCGQEAEARGSETTNENIARLAKQLQETEERLVDTQGKLDDAQDERDAYKAKIEELKQERDKWLNVSQEETTRAGRLADELDAERRRVQSLQELVSELRQHHQNNKLDASSLECDDPDASMHSLHNASVSSEACANVIEVQLVEEKAKVEALEQEIQSLQEQLTELTQRAESEKLALENIITEKDNDISSLKHRINEEVQARTNLTAHFNDEVSKLSNDINELEHKIKENCDSARTNINQKMAEIQTLQEEKLSLLQSLTDETNKLENIIKGLREEIDTEKNVKVRMREDYENKLMKLNEKVLNRNNELVELQNKVFEKGEMMEKLNLELKKEKELNHEVSNKHNDEIAKFNAEKNELEQKLQEKSEEARELQKRLFQNVAVFDELNREIDDLKSANDNILQNYNILEDMKESLQVEVQQRDSDIEGIRKEIENITNIFSEEKDNFTQKLEERNVIITALQVRLQDEIQYKIDLEKELQTLHQARVQLNDEVMKLSKDLSSSNADIAEKERMIYALELYLKEERHANNTLKSNTGKLNEDIVNLSDELSAKTSAVKEFEEKLEQTNLRFEEELRMKDEVIETTNNKLLSEMEEREALQMLLMAVNEEKEIINKDLIDRCNELEKMQEDYDRMCNANEEYMKVIEALGNKIDNETKKYLQLEIDFDTQTTNLMSKLSETERTVKEISSKTRLKMEDRELQIQTLKLQIENLNTTIDHNSDVLDQEFREKEALIHKLEEYQNQCALMDNLSTKLNDDIALKSSEINTLRNELETMMEKVRKGSEELSAMENKMLQESKAAKEFEYQKNQEIKQLKSKIEELQGLNDEFDQELRKEIAGRTQAISALQRENEQLQYTIEEDNSNHEIIIKEKDVLIERLEEHVKVLTVSLESLRKDHENRTFTWEKIKIELYERLEAKDKEIGELKTKVEQLKCCLDKVIVAVEEVQEVSEQENAILKENMEDGTKLQKVIEERVAVIMRCGKKIKELECSKENLEVQLNGENAAKDLLEKEKSELLKQNADLLEELHQEQSVSNSLLAEKKTLEEEKSRLTQQFSEEMSTRTLLEQKIQDLSETKLTIEQQLFEKTAIEATLLEEKEILITEKDSLIQQIKTLEEDKETILEEKEIIEQELYEKETKMQSILQEKENLSQQLEVIHLVKQAHQSEKIAMEQQLIEKDSTSLDLLEENRKLLIEKESLSQQLSSAEAEKEILFTEMQAIEQQLIEKEVLSKALVVEKEYLIAEKDSVDQKMQSLLEEKKVIEKQYLDKVATLNLLIDEKVQIITLETAKIDKIIEERENLVQQLEIINQRNNTLIEENKVASEKLAEEIAAKHVIEKELTTTKEIAENEKQAVIREKIELEEKLNEEKTSKNELLEVKEYLMTQMELTEKQKLDQLHEKEVANSNLKEEIEQLMQKFYKEHAERQVLQQQITEEVTAKTTILEVKEYLAGQLTEEKSAKEVLAEEKEALQEEVRTLHKKLIEEIQLKSKLEEERHYLLHEKNEFIEARHQEISSLKTQILERSQEISILNELLKEERAAKDQLNEDKQNLLTEISTLKHDSIELNAIKDILVHDKELLNVEKEQLIQSLNVEKASRDELECEKNAVSVTLQELNEKYATELKENQEQMTNVSSELKQVKMDFKKHEDISVNIASVVSSGLDKLLQFISKENIGNEVLQNLITVYKEDVPLGDKCELLVSIADTLSTELAVKRNLALEHESSAVKELQEMIKEKEMQVLQLQNEVKLLQKEVQDSQTELENQTKTLNTLLESKVKDIQSLQLENKSLNNELNDVKVQLNVKVHSLKEKLIDNENLTDKLKRTYECQIENLNVMVTKLTSYLKEKTCELDSVRKEKEKLQQTIDENNKAIKSLEDEVKVQKANQEKLITDFESERQVIKNMVTVTESIMEDQKVGHSKVIADYEKSIESYQNEKKILEELLKTAEKKAENIVQDKQCAFDAVFKELAELRKEKEDVVKEFESNIESLNKEIASLKEDLLVQKSATELLEVQNKALEKEREQIESDMKTQKEKMQKEIEVLKGEVTEKVAMVESLQTHNTKTTAVVSKLKDELLSLQGKDAELKIKKDSLESELLNRIEKITKALSTDTYKNNKLKYDLLEKLQSKTTVEEKMKILSDEVVDLVKEKNDYILKWDEAKAEFEAKQTEAKQEIEKWKEENSRLSNYIEENKTLITKLEEQIKKHLEQLNEERERSIQDHLNYQNRCALLQEYQTKAEKHLQEGEKEIASLKTRIKSDANFDQTIENLKEQIADKDSLIAQIAQVKDEIIGTLNKELIDEKESREKYQQELQMKTDEVNELRAKLDEAKAELATLDGLKKDNKELLKVVGQRETFAATSQERMSSNRLTEKELRDRHQKQLYQDQIQVFKMKQKEEMAHLELELQKTKEKLAESSRAYEEHIKALTTELWNVGEKFLVKKDEAEWLRKRQKSGSLISLQHLHSTGLSTNHARIPESPSNSQSLQSLPANCGVARETRDCKKREGRGLHMSDEEGEVFDNRWLKELHTPRRESNAGQRLSELRWRNSLCPPHLKSSYPAETQFVNTLEEEDIKCVGAASLGGRPQRKEVGITAYKKPGPPTPSKQAGRLSATDSELRESLRVEAEPAPSRKTSTPSRIRALFRTGRSDNVDLPESEYPKCETSEYPKDSDRTDTDCDSDRKTDWFNLSLRQRAARWEPLAKD